MTLRRRLDLLEARTSPTLGPVEVVHWIVAPTPGGPRLCGVRRMSDGLALDRAPGEAEAAFRTRAGVALGRPPA